MSLNDGKCDVTWLSRQASAQCHALSEFLSLPELTKITSQQSNSKAGAEGSLGSCMEETQISPSPCLVVLSVHKARMPETPALSITRDWSHPALQLCCSGRANCQFFPGPAHSQPSRVHLDESASSQGIAIPALEKKFLGQWLKSGWRGSRSHPVFQDQANSA